MSSLLTSLRVRLSLTILGLLLLTGAWSPAQAQSMAAHPRLLLDASTLANLRSQQAANTPAWQELKRTCDSLMGGKVNYPTQEEYPDLPNLGSGYEGENYFPALMNEAMCYQVLRTSNPSAAAPYGAKAVDILMKMSTPFTTGSGNLGEDPCIDDGYVIRHYGVGFGLGYDWLYDLLTPAQRQQVYQAANKHITMWQTPNSCASFAYEHPQGNYYAGFFHAQAAIALATYDENPSAPAMWNDWLNNQFLGRVQPYYAQHLVGGGWPEGFANYAPLGVFNMSMPMREVKTATGRDLIHGSAPFTYPLDMANFAMHFTWPSLNYFDDRDTNHSNGGSTPPGTPRLELYQDVLGNLTYWNAPNAPVFNQYVSAVNTASHGYSAADPWLGLLSSSPGAPTAPISSLPLSYFARGMGSIAARSNWTPSAVWMSFRAAPYTNNPGAGEEYFDQGSLALVRGGTPLLLNATGFAVHMPGGNAGETDVYNDNYGNFSSSNETRGNRRPYNIFYVRNMTGGQLAEPYGQEANTLEDDHVRTTVAAYEDGGDYVYTLATHLEDMYRRFRAGPAVSGWAREVVYLRPGRVVVYDRTTAGSAGYDQFMAWHFPANPTLGSAPADESRLDVTYNGTYAGAMTTVLPAKATLKTLALYPDDTPIKAYQIQVRPPSTNTGASQQWLSVFDLATTPAGVATATPVNVTQGGAVGVYLAASDGNDVVVSSTGAAGTPLSGTLAYAVPAAPAHHIVTDLTPNAGYTVAATTSGSQMNIVVTPGGTSVASAKGVLDFTETGSGTPTPPPPKGGVPTASFTYTAQGLTANFTDRSTDEGGVISAHAWTFGDGATSTATNPSHTYAGPGAYTVTEQVTDSVSGDINATSQVVSVTNPPPTGGTPTADFTTTTQGLTATFQDRSTDVGGTIATHAWSFGDGATSTATSPTHTYAAAGTYSVQETVTDGVSHASSTKTASVTVAGPVSTPTQVVTNGGFETGKIAPWGMSDKSMLCRNGYGHCSGERADSGNWFAQLQSWKVQGNHLALAQSITLPARKTSAVLSYALHIDSVGGRSSWRHNTLQVQILNQRGNVIGKLATYSEANGHGGYTVHTSSLKAFLGRTVTLRFLATWTNASKKTTFTLDNIKVAVQ